MARTYADDSRTVMTLDAGGTNLVFSAIQGNKPVVEPITLPSQADRLDTCLGQITQGFTQVQARLPSRRRWRSASPSRDRRTIRRASSATWATCPPSGAAWPLGPMLEDKFKIPVFINNDGDLFVYGEAIAGFLPLVNEELAKAASPKRYKNLFGVTLGTGFGGGIVRDGELFGGDNSAAGEAWLLRHKLDPGVNAEEGCSIRAVRRVYAELAGMAFDKAPEPKVIYEIGMGKAPGDQAAAKEAFRRMGEVAGDAIAQALTLVDGLAVVGGGISGAHALFLPALVDAVNDVFPKTERPAAAAGCPGVQLRGPRPAGEIPEGRQAPDHRARLAAPGAVRPAAAHGRGPLAPGHQRGRGHRRLRLRPAQARLTGSCLTP